MWYSICKLQTFEEITFEESITSRDEHERFATQQVTGWPFEKLFLVQAWLQSYMASSWCWNSSKMLGADEQLFCQWISRAEFITGRRPMICTRIQLFLLAMFIFKQKFQKIRGLWAYVVRRTTFCCESCCKTFPFGISLWNWPSSYNIRKVTHSRLSTYRVTDGKIAEPKTF